MVLSRIGRRVGIDGNPLRRTVDRFQAAFAVVLAAAFLVAGPALAWCAGNTAYRDAVNDADRPSAAQFRVDAVVGKDTVGYYNVADGAGAWHIPVPARWTAPDGTQRTGTIVTDSTSRPGTVVTVWTDRAGNITSGPPSADAAAARGFGAGLATVVGVASLFTCCWLIVVRRLERRRLALWRIEWLQVEPQWSGRR
jgi:hypothetical protein